MQTEILVVDDEQEIADLVELYLGNEGYAVRKFYSAQEALASGLENPPDLAVLDVMMPELDGFTPVSYTHLDVYKRQALLRERLSPCGNLRDKK